MTCGDGWHYGQRVMRGWVAVCSALVHAVALALLGGLLAGQVGLWAGLASGLALGAVFGATLATARVYPPSARGVGLFLVDHSWSLPNTITGAIFLLGHLAAGHPVDRARSRHSGRLAVSGRVWAGYVTTVGTVVAGLRPSSPASLVRHEDLHVLQARIFGPGYLPFVLAHYLLYTIFPVWWLYHDHQSAPITGPGRYFSSGVYPHIWHEAWAYRRQGRPPRRTRAGRRRPYDDPPRG
jgi:hypothetical protein